MTKTYFRVQSGDRQASDLLDPGYQFSHAWNGVAAHSREGVSVCDSVEELALYLASHLGNGIPVDETWNIVELEGDRIEGAAVVDPEFESLVRPTRIVSVQPCGAEFMALIAEQDAFLASFTSGPDFDDED